MFYLRYWFFSNIKFFNLFKKTIYFLSFDSLVFIIICSRISSIFGLVFLIFLLSSVVQLIFVLFLSYIFFLILLIVLLYNIS